MSHLFDRIRHFAARTAGRWLLCLMMSLLATSGTRFEYHFGQVDAHSHGAHGLPDHVHGDSDLHSRVADLGAIALHAHELGPLPALPVVSLHTPLSFQSQRTPPASAAAPVDPLTAAPPIRPPIS